MKKQKELFPRIMALTLAIVTLLSLSIGIWAADTRNNDATIQTEAISTIAPTETASPEETEIPDEKDPQIALMAETIQETSEPVAATEPAIMAAAVKSTTATETTSATEVTTPATTTASEVAKATEVTEVSEATETTKPSEVTEATNTTESSKPVETTVPTEESKPAKESMLSEDYLIKLGDSLAVISDGGDSESDDRAIQPRETIKVTDMYEEDFGEFGFNEYYYLGNGQDVGLYASGNWTRVIGYFTLSDGSTAYCIQPYHAGPEGDITLEALGWHANTREGFARALAYGAPNNGDTSKEGKIATAAIIYDIAMNYRYKDGSYNTYNGSKFTSTPFERVLPPAIREKYDLILYRMGRHGKLIPSFTTTNSSNIGDDKTIVLQYDKKSGLYTASVRDSVGILPNYHFSTDMAGVTITRDGQVLTITATEAAARKLNNGLVISSARSSSAIGLNDTKVWKKDGYNSAGREYQKVVSLKGTIDPTPCFFRIKTDATHGTAFMKKTSDTNDVQGYCFKLYRWQNGKSWYGKSDGGGNIYETNASFNAVDPNAKTYAFSGLTDGTYTVKEVLSVHGAGKVFPTSWTITVTDPNGTPTYNRTFTGGEIVAESNGDAKLNLPKGQIELTGLTGGGKLTMTINNAPIDTPIDAPISIHKDISGGQGCINMVQGNSLYSLADAKYTISMNGEVKETIKTDANGNATSAKKYPIGAVLTIKEIQAPRGFKLNPTPYKWTVKEGGADINLVKVTDVPVADPIFAITKIDKNTTTPQGDSSFQGAIFKWEYFDNMNWSGTPKRTWYLETDRDGYQTFDEEFIADGYNSSDFYYGESGEPSFPLGTVKITEIKNPLGYTVVPHPLKLSIKQNGNNAAHEWTPESLQYIRDAAKGNFNVIEPITPEKGSLILDKIDATSGKTPQGDSSLTGAKFQVINRSANSVNINGKISKPGAVCYEFTTDTNGHHSTGKIFPIGTYEVKEVTAPEGHVVNTGWVKQFKIAKDGQVAQFVNNNGCPNNVIMGGIRIIKQDNGLGANTTKNEPLDGIKFQIANASKNAVTVNGKSYGKGSVIMTLPIAWDGTQWSASTGAAKLPYGTYTVKEVAAKPGMANDFYELNTTVHTVEIRKQSTVISVTHKNQIKPGRIDVHKINPSDKSLAGAEFQLEWSQDGKKWTPVKYNSACTKGSCSSKNLSANGRIVTGNDGMAVFEGLHPTLQYRLTETKAPKGYVLLSTPIHEGPIPITNNNANLKLSFEVVNGTGYTLPDTGKTDWTLITGFTTVLMTSATGAAFVWDHKRKNNR